MCVCVCVYRVRSFYHWPLITFRSIFFSFKPRYRTASREKRPGFTSKNEIDGGVRSSFNAF